jgi:hypothetical protein
MRLKPGYQSLSLSYSNCDMVSSGTSYSHNESVYSRGHCKNQEHGPKRIEIDRHGRAFQWAPVVDVRCHGLDMDFMFDVGIEVRFFE